jgi:hypothetical protein
MSAVQFVEAYKRAWNGGALAEAYGRLSSLYHLAQRHSVLEGDYSTEDFIREIGERSSQRLDAYAEEKARADRATEAAESWAGQYKVACHSADKLATEVARLTISAARKATP